ncbi:unnamed protein product [Meganyctiphanes norvegica]|uniref:Uncharacterized protein n=1 Tax=Meganyctiphanes norvegica TaxID=48144 RepID=A0AAV2R273_MEGNR
MVLAYARTGTRSWSIGGEAVTLKPFRGRRASMAHDKPKSLELDMRRKSMPAIPHERTDPLNQKANYNVKLVPDSPLIIEQGPPPPPKPVRKQGVQKKRSQTVEVSFTFVIGGYNNFSYT